MSDELPSIPNHSLELTWTRPYIVVTNDDHTITVYKTTATQQKVDVEELFSFDKAEEEAFRIVALQPIQFGDARINVLNESSQPTAADYLAKVGTRVMCGFRCAEVKSLSDQHGKPVYRIYRSYLTLP